MGKQRLTRQEEFDILKLILDKFLWLGVGIMAYGFYRIINLTADFWYSLSIMAGGAVLLMIFMAIMLREYHFLKG